MIIGAVFCVIKMSSFGIVTLFLDYARIMSVFFLLVLILLVGFAYSPPIVTAQPDMSLEVYLETETTLLPWADSTFFLLLNWLDGALITLFCWCIVILSWRMLWLPAGVAVRNCISILTPRSTVAIRYGVFKPPFRLLCPLLYYFPIFDTFMKLL